ncbi:hypothetical protein N7499_002038 [Penicillium canescens]|nr:hypothetical protein N7499_002038 [Penicillium canescens]KAJ6165652.1 hypothetical protein N7485_008896 [Penicillium canescens]
MQYSHSPQDRSTSALTFIPFQQSGHDIAPADRWARCGHRQPVAKGSQNPLKTLNALNCLVRDEADQTMASEADHWGRRGSTQPHSNARLLFSLVEDNASVQYPPRQNGQFERQRHVESMVLGTRVLVDTATRNVYRLAAGHVHPRHVKTFTRPTMAQAQTQPMKEVRGAPKAKLSLPRAKAAPNFHPGFNEGGSPEFTPQVANDMRQE